MPPARYHRDNCPSAHSVSNGSTWTRGTDEAVEQIICTDGREQFKMRCRLCNTAGGPVSPRQLNAWGLSRHDIEIVRQNESRAYEPCTVLACSVTPTEMHHFAPRNTFTTEADLWPCLPLCRAHHVEWHRRMDGYRWHAKAVA